ncbi:hypothetical protein VP1G_09664 [Cytospora mali]|uniref:Rhodopsin domain-containing protein n=1 Tax=Cytospora mali TaxID=578113 RepID=A0A194VF98_CYTMA|nr:hypothetical protein VP1G_09664 [Valsa mali var. pyri (nom. inval.)]
MKLGLDQRAYYPQAFKAYVETRDAIHVPNRGPEVNDVLWALTGISNLFLSLRIYCKFYRHRDLWWDDWLLLLSWMLLLGNSIVTNLNVNLGFGLHLANTDPANRETMILLGSISVTFSTLSAVWSKTSFGFTLLRLTQVGYEKTRVFIWAIIVSMNLLMFFAAIYPWIECQPSQKHWHVHLQGTCWGNSIGVNFGIAAGAYSGCMDIIMALLPWPMILQTRMERREKIGVLVAMSMGLVAGAAAFAKCSQEPKIIDVDESYTGASLVIWGAAEPAITIMAASIPALRVLLADIKHYTQRRLSGESESHGSNFDFWDGDATFFKWGIFGGSKSNKLPESTSPQSDSTWSTATTMIPLDGSSLGLWTGKPPEDPPVFNCDIFQSSKIDGKLEVVDTQSTTTCSLSTTITSPTPSQKCPDLSKQFEDFLRSRRNSCAGTLSDVIFEGDTEAVLSSAMVSGRNSVKSVTKSFFDRKRNSVRSMMTVDKDTYGLSSVLENGRGDDHIVIVQTTEITIEYDRI